MNREKIEKRFHDYAFQYDLSDPKINLKYYHTYRVAALCEQIAHSVGLSDSDRDYAWMCGMLHDIGRFEQITRYGTFKDSESVNHAHFGVELLFEEGMITEYLPEDLTGSELADLQNLIRKSIYHHSDFRLPEDLTKREQTFCKILRDADKIDILRVNVEVPMEEIYNTTAEELRESAVSPQTLQAFMTHSAVPHSRKSTVVDHLVGHISLVFELEYPISLEIVSSQGYLEKMLHFQSDNPICNEQFSTIRTVMEAYLQNENRKISGKA